MKCKTFFSLKKLKKKKVPDTGNIPVELSNNINPFRE